VIEMELNGIEKIEIEEKLLYSDCIAVPLQLLVLSEEE